MRFHGFQGSDVCQPVAGLWRLLAGLAGLVGLAGFPGLAGLAGFALIALIGTFATVVSHARRSEEVGGLGILWAGYL
jgi:hypothetical protein